MEFTYSVKLASVRHRKIEFSVLVTGRALSSTWIEDALVGQHRQSFRKLFDFKCMFKRDRNAAVRQAAALCVTKSAGVTCSAWRKSCRVVPLSPFRQIQNYAKLLFAKNDFHIPRVLHA